MVFHYEHYCCIFEAMHLREWIASNWDQHYIPLSHFVVKFHFSLLSHCYHKNFNLKSLKSIRNEVGGSIGDMPKSTLNLEWGSGKSCKIYISYFKKTFNLHASRINLLHFYFGAFDNRSTSCAVKQGRSTGHQSKLNYRSAFPVRRCLHTHDFFFRLLEGVLLAMAIFLCCSIL